MTLSTAQLITEINSQLPTNSSGQISASKLRTVLIDIVNNVPDPAHILTANGGFLYEKFLFGNTTPDPTFAINSDNRIIIDGDVATPTNGESYAFAIQHAFGGGTGSRFALNTVMVVNGPITGDACAERALSYATANAGGTGIWTPTTVDVGWKGDLFGGNDNTRLAPGATFWRVLVGREIDIAINTGASCFAKVGLLLVNDGEQATADDCMIAMNGVTAAKTGISFGITWGGWPFNSTSTLIGTQRRLYPTDAGVRSSTAAYGINFSDVTFSQFAIFTNNFAVDDAGACTANGGFWAFGARLLGARSTGWTAMTGTADLNSTFATGSVTLVQLAQRVKALQDTLMGHGLIGV